MFKNLSSIIVNKVYQNGLITREEIDENICGLNTFLTLMVNVLSAVLIGIAFKMLDEIILFIFVYKSLRKYIGGSHASNARLCYIYSCIIYVVVLICIRYYWLSSMVTTAFVCGSLMILWLLAPVEAPKKPLDPIEYDIFRRRSRITILICLCAFISLHYIPNQYTYYYSNVIAVSIYAVTLFAVIGKLKIIKLKKSSVHY